MANLIDYNGKSKVIKRICYLINNYTSKIQDVRRNDVSVLDEDTGIANVSVPELGTGAGEAYPGNLGDAAYQHSLLTQGNPHHVTAEDLGLETLQDQINALAEAIGTVSYWQDHDGTFITDHDGENLQFHTVARILEYH